MITVSFDIFVLGYLIAGLSFLLGLWFYYDRRDRNFYDAQRHAHAFHCVRCDMLYMKKGSSETAPCPRCGFVNGRLKF